MIDLGEHHRTDQNLAPGAIAAALARGLRAPAGGEALVLRCDLTELEFERIDAALELGGHDRPPCKAVAEAVSLRQIAAKLIQGAS